MPPSTSLYAAFLPVLHRLCCNHPITQLITEMTLCVPHSSNAIDSATLMTVASSNVYRAISGSSTNSSISFTDSKGASRTTILNAVRVNIENINHPIIHHYNCLHENGTPTEFCLPFVRMDFLYGGPMLKTAATRIYWKDEIKKRTVFSKFLALSSLSSEGSLVGGGLYLQIRVALSISCQSEITSYNTPYLSADPDVCPGLHDTRDYDLPNYACQHFFRHKARCRPLREYSRERKGSSHFKTE